MSAVLSNSDNAPRPVGTFAGEINRTLTELMEANRNIVLGGQLIKYGFAGSKVFLFFVFLFKFSNFLLIFNPCSFPFLIFLIQRQSFL